MYCLMNISNTAVADPAIISKNNKPLLNPK